MNQFRINLDLLSEIIILRKLGICSFIFLLGSGYMVEVVIPFLLI